jgi:hypothetical protein
LSFRQSPELPPKVSSSPPEGRCDRPSPGPVSKHVLDDGAHLRLRLARDKHLDPNRHSESVPSIGLEPCTNIGH